MYCTVNRLIRNICIAHNTHVDEVHLLIISWFIFCYIPNQNQDMQFLLFSTTKWHRTPSHCTNLVQSTFQLFWVCLHFDLDLSVSNKFKLGIFLFAFVLYKFYLFYLCIPFWGGKQSRGKTFDTGPSLSEHPPPPFPHVGTADSRCSKASTLLGRVQFHFPSRICLRDRPPNCRTICTFQCAELGNYQYNQYAHYLFVQATRPRTVIECVP